MRYKIWILDLDGTAADTLQSIARTANQVLEEEGLMPQPEEKYKVFAGDGQSVLLERALKAAGDGELSHYERALRRYAALFKTGCTYGVKPYAGLKEVLEKAKAAGILLAILSNKRHENTVSVVEAAYGPDFFHKVTGHQDAFEKKPSPQGVFLILESFGLTPKDCLYIGDTDVDMQTGKRAGAATAGVTWGFRSRRELEENGAGYIIDRPEELLEMIG